MRAGGSVLREGKKEGRECCRMECMMNGVFVGNRERRGDVGVDVKLDADVDKYSLRESRHGIPSREICHRFFHCSQNEPIHHSFDCT